MIDQGEEGKNHFGLVYFFPVSLTVFGVIHELDGASFSDKVEGVHACFWEAM